METFSGVFMLHIVNGDSTAGTLATSGVPGELLSWTEALMMGPAPRESTGEEWRSVRARHISQAYGLHLYASSRELSALEAALDRADAHDEIVLWFDPDLFCQVNLLYLLNRFSRRDPPPKKLSLVCAECETPSRGAGRFRALGELDAGTLAALFDKRAPLTVQDVRAAALAWAAYVSPDPEDLVALIRRDVPATGTGRKEAARTGPAGGTLGHLDDALRAHLERFPRPKTGLGRIELGILDLLRGGSRGFGALFREFSAQHPVYGLGDFQFYLAIRSMAQGAYPLVSIHIPDTVVDRRRSSPRPAPRRRRTREDGSSSMDEILEGRASRRFKPRAPLDSERLLRAVITITPAGLAVRSGRADFLMLNRPDDWLGGVHLRPGSIWRWDEGSSSVVRG